VKRFASLFSWSFALLAALVLFNVIQYLIYWSPTEDVTFRNGDVVLSGTLIKPDETGIFPAVIVLHGSGPETLSDPAYKVTANTLLRSGFAVLLYDKRGVGKSGGIFEKALYGDFISDAIAAVHYLRSRTDIDATNIGLFGNSESGWFTPEIAFRAGNIAFVFNRVGPPLSWMETVLWEVRNEFLDAGVAEADVDALVEITERRWRYYQAAGFDPSLADSPQRAAINADLQMLRGTIPLAEEVLPEELRAYDREFYANFAIDSLYDPGPYLQEIDVPMYYAFGETDVNVPTKASVAFLQQLRDQHGKNIEYSVFDGVGHSLMHWTGMLTGGYLPAYLELAETWTVDQLR
jgi:pimeloyl-ACP methyl ester carboxylesterase